MIGTNPETDLFFEAYVECALWASTDDKGSPMDKRFSASQISKESLASMERDCIKFFRENNLAELSSHELKQAGHDFWLTRNRHGAGFWDGDWPEPQASHLTIASHAFGSSDLYVGDDESLHVSPLHSAEVIGKESDASSLAN